VPCSISALVWSAVTTRGLETILPLPSASSADSSRLRKRLAAELNSEMAKLAGEPRQAQRRQAQKLRGGG
jgi:hypothetical protein